MFICKAVYVVTLCQMEINRNIRKLLAGKEITSYCYYMPAMNTIEFVMSAAMSVEDSPSVLLCFFLSKCRIFSIISEMLELLILRVAISIRFYKDYIYFEGIFFAYHLDLCDCLSIDGLPDLRPSLGSTTLHTSNFVFAEDKRTFWNYLDC